jgi:hypothetical protein
MKPARKVAVAVAAEAPAAVVVAGPAAAVAVAEVVAAVVVDRVSGVSPAGKRRKGTARLVMPRAVQV